MPVRITDKISGQVGVRARRMLREEADFLEVAPDSVISPFETNEDFQSIYVGTAYRNETMSASGRVEVRDTTDDQTWVMSGSVARDLSDTLSLAATARGRISGATGELGTDKQYEARIGAIDLGFRGQLMTNKQAGTAYSWGPSIGVSPVDNVWLSAGYNVEGFKDKDFEAAEYSRKGAYLQLRVKFDQAEPVAPKVLSKVEIKPVVAANDIVASSIVQPKNLNQCGRSPIAIFNVPVDSEPKQLSRLGTLPQFGNSQGLTPSDFYEKLNARYLDNDKDKAYLDHLFVSLGYSRGWLDARPKMFTEETLAVGTRGLMGFGQPHHYSYSILPVAEQDREAFRIQSANGSVVHFMKSCGNYMYACE